MGPQRADLLKKELGIYTFNDLLYHFPFRHIDRTKITLVSAITPTTEYAQVAGVITGIEIIGKGPGKRLVASLADKSDEIELVWFQGINWIQKSLVEGHAYLVYGRISFFNGKAQMVHPDFEILTEEKKEGFHHY